MTREINLYHGSTPDSWLVAEKPEKEHVFTIPEQQKLKVDCLCLSEQAKYIIKDALESAINEFETEIQRLKDSNRYYHKTKGWADSAIRGYQEQIKDYNELKQTIASVPECKPISKEVGEEALQGRK